MTPFMILLGQSAPLKTIQSWVSTLANQGIDMQKYGEMKHRFITEHDWDASAYYHHASALKYGSKPSDWGLWYQHVGDAFAGTFWGLIACPELALPGSWPEDRNYDHEDNDIRLLRRPIRRSGVKRRVLRRMEVALKCAVRHSEENQSSKPLIFYDCVLRSKRVQSLTGKMDAAKFGVKFTNVLQS